MGLFGGLLVVLTMVMALIKPSILPEPVVLFIVLIWLILAGITAIVAVVGVVTGIADLAGWQR